jgi:hypothetical protein
MTYSDGSPVAIGDTVRLPGWDYIFEVSSYRVGGGQVVIRNVTPGSLPSARAPSTCVTSSRCGTRPANRIRRYQPAKEGSHP